MCLSHNLKCILLFTCRNETRKEIQLVIYIYQRGELKDPCVSTNVKVNYRSVFLPTNAQKECLKRCIKIYIKNAPKCFGVNTIIRERTI